MKKDIKEQLEKLQYYGEFYAKSDVDDKIKLEELDKSGEISEFGRNFSPQVDHKYTMVVSDRRSYLLGNGRGGKDFTNFLTTLEKLDNEKYLGLRESLETDPARYHIYTHRGDLLEAFNGVYDEELNTIGNNFGEVYNEVNEAIKRGGVDLTDYPDLERAFDDYELKILDKEIWERDNNYIKFYMDNAYEYLNEKNVLLEEAKMLDVEKHKNVGADLETINDGSLLDGLSENISIPESEKVAGGYDLASIEENEEITSFYENPNVDSLRLVRRQDVELKDTKITNATVDTLSERDEYELVVEEAETGFKKLAEFDNIKEKDISNGDFNSKLVIETLEDENGSSHNNIFVIEQYGDNKRDTIDYIDEFNNEDNFVACEFGKLGTYYVKYSEINDKDIFNVYHLLNSDKYGDVNNILDDVVNDVNSFSYMNDRIAELEKINVTEQDFINAVNSVTNKEQDKGMEL